MGTQPKKISEPKIAHGYFQYWLATLRYKRQADSVSYHPALTMEDKLAIDEINNRFRILSVRWAAAGTAVVYATYYFGLRHRSIFYMFMKKNPSILNRLTRRVTKFFVIPLLVFNIAYGLSIALMKDYCHTKIKEKGLYQKYHLEYIIESKPF
jgi:hypothetical protein